MTNGYFITGTDTGIGKTLVAQGLLRNFADQGLQVAAMKPVASGCVHTANGLRNEDATSLQAASSVVLDYEQVNPYAFAPAVAPHIAAAHAGVTIEPDVILRHFRHIRDQADVVIVEGVGGWRVPLADNMMLADLAVTLGLPVILVVGLRLGCLNHALLSASAIEDSGLTLAGWVANGLREDFEYRQQNIAALAQHIDAPLLGVIPHLHTPGPAEAARWLDTAKLYSEREKPANIRE